MKNLNQMKSAAENSGQSEAKLVREHIASLEEDGADDDLIRASLDELIDWASSFRDSIGVA